MKKTIITLLVSLCACAFALVGCAKKEAALNPPTFKSQNVNTYLKDLAAYCTGAPENFKNPANVVAYAGKMEEFRKRQAAVVKELQGDAEVQAFNKYVDDVRQYLEKALGTHGK